MSINTNVFLQATVGGLIGIWLIDVITSNLVGHRVLHQAGTAQQACVDCDPSTTTPGSFDCKTCAAVGTAGAPAFGCTSCTPGTTPGSFDCTGCEGYTCATCTAGATPGSFTCTSCIDAVTAATNPAAAPAVDPCAAVTTPCIYVDSIKGCAHQGNSSCTCSGCKKPSTSKSTSTPSKPAPLTTGTTPTTAKPTLTPRLASPVSQPAKICPPLVKC